MRERYILGHTPNAAHLMFKRMLESHGALIILVLKDCISFLDCGSGLGTITYDVVKPILDGRVLRLDNDKSQVKLAFDHARGRNRQNVECHLGSTYELPFPSG